MTIEQVAAQAAADELPTHPLLGRWMACLCGSLSCDRVTPSRIGNFYMGTGFNHAEARELVAMLKKNQGRRNEP